MNATRSRLALVGGWLLLAPAAVPALPLPTAPSALVVRVSPWAFPSRPLGITLDQSGVLAGRHLAVYLFVDENLVDRVTTTADRTRARLPVPGLAPGRHLLTVRTGREVAQAEFRVLSWSWLAGGGAFLMGGAGAGLWSLRLRLRRRSGQPGA